MSSNKITALRQIDDFLDKTEQKSLFSKETLMKFIRAGRDYMADTDKESSLLEMEMPKLCEAVYSQQNERYIKVRGQIVTVIDRFCKSVGCQFETCLDDTT